MPSIRDFSGGVVNQVLQNKDTGAGVLFDCKNVLSSWNGELRKRTGTSWLRNLDAYKRMIPYRMPDGNDILLLFGDGAIEGYEKSGKEGLKPFYVYTGNAPQFPTSGWAGVTTNGNYTINLNAGSASSEWGRGFDTVTGRPIKWRGNGATWNSGYGTSANAEAYIEISSTDAQLFNSAILRWTYSVSGNHTGTYRGFIEPTIQFSDDGNNWVSIETEMTNPNPFGGADMYQASYHYGIGSGEITENYTSFMVRNINHTEPHRFWRVRCARRITNTETYGGSRLELNVYSIKYLSNTKEHFIVNPSSDSFEISDSTVENIRFAQNGTLMILTNEKNQPYHIQYSGGTFEYGTFSSSLSVQEGAPACVSFYQNRLWFGGFVAHPTRVWASAFGNFADFSIPSTVLSTSAIMADAVEIQSRIENMWGGNNALYCLSEDGVSMIDAQGGIVATDQIEFKLRNREPVNDMTPTYKDDIMIYLGRDKRKVLITDYDYVVQRFKAQNISKAYTDFLHSGIRELHYIPDSASLVYGLLENGSWFALLFDLDTGKNSIYPFDTDGKVLDIQPLKYGNSTAIIMVVQRYGQYFLEEKITVADQERMDFMSAEQRQEYTREVTGSDVGYFDCMVKRTFETPADTIDNLPYNSATKVSVIADGVYLGEKELLSGTSSPLYAWRVGEQIVYTRTETPTTADTLYNENNGEITELHIVSVADGKITAEGVTKPYTVWRDSTSVVASGSTYNRNGSADTYLVSQRTGKRTYCFGWGSYWSTYPNLLTGKTLFRGIGDGSPLSITSDSYNDYLVEGNTLPAVGSVVYDTDFNKVGIVSNTGTISAGDVYSYSYYYIEFGDKRVYGKCRQEGATIHTMTIENFTQTLVFDRDTESDLISSTTSLKLDFEASEVVMGYNYDSYAVIKFVSPYNLRKFPKEISANFINTGYLEMGNTFDSLEAYLQNMRESVILNNKPILYNGNYTKTFDKQAFETPYIIIRSNVGLPFIITGLDYKVDISNYQGGV